MPTVDKTYPRVTEDRAVVPIYVARDIRGKQIRDGYSEIRKKEAREKSNKET
jgi:hypothetical protein